MTLLLAGSAQAAPAARLLRIDPRTAVSDGNPVVTTLLDLSENRRLGELLAPCASLSGDAQLDCTSDALEKPGSLAAPVPFPEKQALFTVKVGETDEPAPYLGHTRFGETQNEPGVGTAWLIVLDADAHGSSALDELVAVARRFVDAMGPNDLVNLVVLSDRQVASDSRWLSVAKRSSALDTLTATQSAFKSPGRTRPLLGMIKQAATDAFGALGNPSDGLKVPLHQALVVLSSGYGGGDPSTTGPGATQLSTFLTQGRLAEGNAALPKTPVPVISILTPPSGLDEHRLLSREFMQNLANPEIGGFFSVIRDGQAAHATRIVDTVRSRFAQMIVARFRLSCVAPTTTQSFSLLFQPPAQIAGDATFTNVPLGFEPSDWPLDVDAELTRKKALDAGGVEPGGTVRVFGNFCWGGDLTRPEVYFLPPGESLPRDLSGESLDAARQVQKRLIALDMRGTALSANESFAEFSIPDSDSIIHGEGEAAVVRLIVVDRPLRRTSGVSEATVLQLKGRSHSLNLLPWLLGAGAALLALVGLGFFLRRSSQERARRSTNPPPRFDGSPYATPSPVTRSPRGSAPELRATLSGPAGRFVLLPGADLRVGRDGARCAVVLNHPQVSGLHATFRIDGDRVLVRDEGSTSGTRVAGRLLEAGRFIPLEDGNEVQLGPETLQVKIG
ncbi:MAG TPA: FHA domain-containing protein [Polyangiaceae bacterium]|nr:FHA domain-containing protein [Polyangiaceae bacterium]